MIIEDVTPSSPRSLYFLNHDYTEEDEKDELKVF